ncbi:MAG: prepilin-type N-terminal cleavage/methylation domain-containing protein [Planctomycetes bacterium]|nr:prepilin-type N-terminal cleavage/methylation domain-containing protein [Planctomycetota bacterium]
MRHTKFNTLKKNCRSRISQSRNCFCKKAHGGGFTIVELLIALAIASMLLASIAVAINASIINYRENEDMFKVINSARQALLRITNHIRTAEAADPNAPANECSLIAANGDDITYQYNNGDNKLYLIDNGSGSSYVLCENVTAMTFTKQTFIDNSVTKVRGVQVSITVTQGNAERKISAAAVIRRNLNW